MELTACIPQLQHNALSINHEVLPPEVFPKCLRGILGEAIVLKFGYRDALLCFRTV